MSGYLAPAAVLALVVAFPAAAQEFRGTASSAFAVTREDGNYTATVMPDACDPTPYPEMTESDCQGGNRRSQMIARAPAGQGESWEYGFSFRVPAGFEYVPTELLWEIAGIIPDQRFWLFSRVNMVEWKKDRPKNHIYHLKLDSVLGATFLDRVCATPETFGEWVDFRMRVKWGARGFIQVSCNDEVILEALTDTSQSPYCVPPLHCIPGQQADPGHVNQQLEMFVGLTAEANAYGLPPIVPPDGWSLHYRDLYQRRIDDPAPPFVCEAQQALLDAGFDPKASTAGSALAPAPPCPVSSRPGGSSRPANSMSPPTPRSASAPRCPCPAMPASQPPMNCPRSARPRPGSPRSIPPPCSPGIR